MSNTPKSGFVCKDCRNHFLQPPSCVMCGAQKLYDKTVSSQQSTIECLYGQIADLQGTIKSRNRTIMELEEIIRSRDRKITKLLLDARAMGAQK